MRTPERALDSEESARSPERAGQPDTSGTALDVRGLRSLQGSAGNAAVSRLLASRSAPASAGPTPTADSRPDGLAEPATATSMHATGAVPPGTATETPADVPNAVPGASTQQAAPQTESETARDPAASQPRPADPSPHPADSTSEPAVADTPQPTPAASRAAIATPAAQDPKPRRVRPPAGDHPLKSLRTAHRESHAPPPAAKAAELKHPPAGGGVPAAPAVMFADTDVDALLPPDIHPKRRQPMVDAITEELAADRVTAQASVTAFVTDRRARTAELSALKPGLTATVTAANAAALTSIDQAVRAQVGDVRAAVRDVRTGLRAQAQQARAQVESDFSASLAAIRAATVEGRGQVQGTSTAASGRAGVLESGQITRLGGRYVQVEGQFRTVAQNAGSLAVREATTRATAYRAHKINREDSFLDGHLTDNRCDAEAEAAEKVGAAYRDGLGKEADKQVDALRGRRPTDEAAVHHLADDARGSLQGVLGHAFEGLTGAETQSLDNARTARAAVLDTIAETLRTAEVALTRHESSQVAAIQARAEQHKQAVTQAAGTALHALDQAVQTAVDDTDTGLTTLVTELGAAGVPDPVTLDQTLLDTGVQLDTRLAQLADELRAQANQAGQALHTNAQATADTLRQTATAAVTAAQHTGAGSADSLATAKSRGAEGLADLAKGHRQAVDGVRTGHDSAVTTVLGGLSTGFDKLDTAFTDGATRQVDAVREGLTNAVHQDMPAAISTEAAKARAEVQPRWKSVLKWVVIIAIVLVVAIVLGPLVIGAVTGAAAALGASAGAAGLIGMVVGGALVGAATSAATTVVDNAFSGRDLTTGLGTAIAVGALGGALGGAASGLLAGPMQGMSQLARYAAQVGVDMVVDTGINAATGNLSWENFGTGLLMSALVNGVTAHPRVQAVQHGMTSRGYGAGFGTATSARTFATKSGGPGSAGPITVDAAHVNAGDTAGPNSPYGGTWDMKGGGHNANEIRPRAASEGITSAPVDVDPVTGVAIDKFTRPALDNAGNTIPDANQPGGIKIKDTDKSLFPDTMDRPEIAAAATKALELAIAGTPQTTHTPPGTHPNGSPSNGKFSAIVTTADGHPIRVEGYYRPAAGGGWEITTVYPATDLPAGKVVPVPGSQVSVPGGVFTPPDYDSGD
ncbi:hypothetical protein Aglo01_39080 [Actinokineospora globicatena]|nr:hypothetical protein Aglo01_39080 [Actinokineospora globicatena]GLW86164.1 hypothetical protein Aglo02_38030 [Actinokineospora globicatena]